MRIAIVGPTHPYKGGIAQHTTELAHRLAAAGHTVSLISWRAQYPFFYPGAMFVPDGRPELPTFSHTQHVLSWKRPDSWLRWGRRLRAFDQVILVWWVPTIQGPVYAAMLKAMAKRPRVTLLCHNVLPHEPRIGDQRLVKAVIKHVDKVIVHSPAQARLARQLGGKSVVEADLPLAVPAQWENRSKARPLRHRLLFFGIVRPYKGLDILLKALAKTPGIKLTVAGEFWGGEAAYRTLVEELGLTNRVTIEAGYVPADKLHELIGQADAIVLPYRHGTGSWNVALAHAYGRPVIATRAGSLAQQVRHEIDGLLCEAADVDALAKALQHFYKPGVAAKLQAGVPTDQTDQKWQAYVKSLTTD